MSESGEVARSLEERLAAGETVEFVLEDEPTSFAAVLKDGETYRAAIGLRNKLPMGLRVHELTRTSFDLFVEAHGDSLEEAVEHAKLARARRSEIN